MPEFGRLAERPELHDAADPADGSERPALVLRDVTVTFGGIRALVGITTDIAVNELAAIVGPNGAGKTTLLNAVSGLIRGNATGHVELLGQSVMGKSPYAIAKCGLGRSFQDPPLLEKETVVENILVGAHLSLGYGGFDQIFRRRKVGRLEREAIAKADAVMEFTHLAEHAKKRVDGLPYGTRKLVDIARAMVSGPRVLFLDEPTSGLDADEQKVVRELLLELRSQQRMTIVLVEHHMDLVRAVATSVIGLQAGAVLAVGTAEEVLDSEAFRAAVVGAATDDAADFEEDEDHVGEPLAGKG